MADKYAQARVGPERRSEPIADVATADADATYGQPEADLINELKAQVNLLLEASRKAGFVKS